ncbi:unnamed protein product [Prorocentrum cordatum]|uniref:Uncharacterized protein n=1 Tax=Prorocentrum cordatum TaxID=2364126 RepID=A0ABN9TL11_9DINO|nr:unnamed protein product [Polarella glacialis]
MRRGPPSLQNEDPTSQDGWEQHPPRTPLYRVGEDCAVKQSLSHAECRVKEVCRNTISLSCTDCHMEEGRKETSSPSYICLSRGGDCALKNNMCLSLNAT